MQTLHRPKGSMILYHRIKGPLNDPGLKPLCLCSQAALDAREAEAAQNHWLQEHIRKHFTPLLLQMTRDIMKLVAPGGGDTSHVFPQLAGSHLSEVRRCVRQGPSSFQCGSLAHWMDSSSQEQVHAA